MRYRSDCNELELVILRLSLSLCLSLLQNQTLYYRFVYTQLPLGEATVIVFTAPIFTSLIARIYLKEYIGSSQAVLMCLST